MKYSETVVLRGVEIPPARRFRRGRRPKGYRRGRRFEQEVLVDLRRYHPFAGWGPRRSGELAEEIGARLTVLAVRTHVPVAGQRRPPVTLRMRHALRVLSRWGGRLSVSELARHIGVGVPAASQLSARMVRRGLVTKAKREVGLRRLDRRVCLVTLTKDGWRHVPRDEPPRRDALWLGRGDEVWGEGVSIGAWPPGLRRVTQPPAPVEVGLRCEALETRGLLAGLRAVQATVLGFSYARWELRFQQAVVSRRRYRRDRHAEAHAVGLLPRPQYGVRAPRGRRRRPRGREVPGIDWWAGD